MHYNKDKSNILGDKIMKVLLILVLAISLSNCAATGQLNKDPLYRIEGTGIKLPPQATDFKVVDNKVVFK